jgi:hypothetical protein
MPVETPSLFAQIIQQHLELKERNSTLEQSMPIERYRNDDPFENHPLFKTEEQARIEETLSGEVSLHASGVQPWPGEELPAADVEDVGEALWSRTRDFDWGD